MCGIMYASVWIPMDVFLYWCAHKLSHLYCLVSVYLTTHSVAQSVGL
jgi:hypothetical protein